MNHADPALRSTAGSGTVRAAMAGRDGASRRRSTTEWLAIAFATVAGVGYLPIAPGTWGTIAAVPLVPLAAAVAPPWGHVGLLAVVFALGVPAAGVAERLLGRKDAKPVVIDEVAGFLVTMLLVPITRWTLLAGFFLFRVFDVVKPYPANRMERHPGGIGIMADDLVSGVYANLALQLGLVAFSGGK